MMKPRDLTYWLVPLLNCAILFMVSCSRIPMAEISPPTPTPLASGNIFFEPFRIATETKAIVVEMVNLKKARVPVVEHTIVITEPSVLQAITTTLIDATSIACTTALPTLKQKSDYGINLYLYSRSESPSLHALSGEGMIAEVHYYYEVNYIGIYRRNQCKDQCIQEFCPVGTALREILERELNLRGLTFPH